MLRLMGKKLLSIHKASIQKLNGYFTPDNLFILRAKSDNVNMVHVNNWAETLSEIEQKRVRFIQNEMAVMVLDHKFAPDPAYITVEHFQHLMTLSTNQRKKYYIFLYKSTQSSKNNQEKRELRAQLFETNKKLQEMAKASASDKPKHIEYGLGKNFMLPKIYPRTMDKWKNMKTFQRMLIPDWPKIIFDCGFDAEMTYRENQNTAKQLMYCFGINRAHRSPFHMYLCNMNKQGIIWKCLKRCIPTLGKKPLPMTILEKDIHHVIPTEKIIYLCPDSSNVLDKFDPSMHYVVGAIVDRGENVPHTLAKCKELGIQTASLPLDKFRNFRKNKNLTLDQILKIMLEVKFSGDWDKAFNHIPQRKVK